MAMATEGRAATAICIILAATLLLWPAFWNGYPLVFSDTGTYLSQAIERYAGWDRPVFYSVFLLALHLTLTTWPAIVVQALLVAYVLHLLQRTLVPERPTWWLLPLTFTIAFATALPWFAAQLMPDVFTGVLVIVISLLIFVPQRLSTREQVWLVALAAFSIAAHQSHVPLALALLVVLVPLRHRLGVTEAPTGTAWLRAALPLALAMIAMASVNLAAFGRASLAPFSNVFVLARVIYDGPGMDVLRRDCPGAGWRLCGFIDQFPATSDEFLWREDSPVARAGGANLVSAEANAIIGRALQAEPVAVVRALFANAMQQLMTFRAGDGLQAWPTSVTPWIQREFPAAEMARYASARQTQGALQVPEWLIALHTVTAVTGIAVSCTLLWLPTRRQHPISGVVAATLLALIVNAAITGGLSGPHDRYQSRIMWLPPLVAIIAVASERSLPRAAFSR